MSKMPSHQTTTNAVGIRNTQITFPFCGLYSVCKWTLYGFDTLRPVYSSCGVLLSLCKQLCNVFVALEKLF